MLINNYPYLRKSTQDDSMGRYSILHLLVYHCFDYKEAKESQVESLIDFPPPNKASAYLPSGFSLDTVHETTTSRLIHILFSDALLIPASSSSAPALRP